MCLFLLCEPKRSKPDLQKPLRRVEVKNSHTTKETWVIRVEKCHFGSCSPLHWSVRIVIKSDSCTIDNAPPAHPWAELPSTLSASPHTLREAFSEPVLQQRQPARGWFLLAWLVLTLTPPDIAKETQQNQPEASLYILRHAQTDNLTMQWRWRWRRLNGSVCCPQHIFCVFQL